MAGAGKLKSTWKRWASIRISKQMDVHVDDSYFESEEQACEDSEAEQKRKEEEKKKYCARRCELNVRSVKYIHYYACK